MITNKMLPSPEFTTLQETLHKSSLTSGDYIYDETFPATKFIRRKFIGDHNKLSDCWRLLNINSNIFGTIEEAYVDGVGQPQGVYSDFTDTGLMVQDAVKSFIATGYVAIEVTGEPTMEIIPSEEFYIYDCIPTRVRFITKHDDKDQPYTDFWIKRYFNGENTHEFWRVKGTHKDINGTNCIPCKGYYSPNGGSAIDMEDTIWNAEGVVDGVEVTGLDGLSVAYGDYRPILHDVQSLVFSIERKLVGLNNELLDFIRTKEFYKGQGFASIDEKDLEKDRIVLPLDNGSIEYIKNDNPNVLKSWESIKEELRLISAKTRLPVEDFGLAQGSSLSSSTGGERVRSRKYVKRIEYIRDVICSVIFDAVEIANKVRPVQTPEITWDDALITDERELAETLEILAKAGIFSPEELKEMYINKTTDGKIGSSNEIQ